MTCPRCGHDILDVSRTRRRPDHIERERYCTRCYLHVITHEQLRTVLVYRPSDRKTVEVSPAELEDYIRSRAR